MKRLCTLLLSGIAVCCLLLTLSAQTADAAKKPPKPDDKQPPVAAAPPFTLETPAGWQLFKSGECDILTLYMQNSAEPLQQLFFFPRFGPVYMTQEQKSADLQYEGFSGKAMSRRDMPIVDPLTPDHFVRFLPQILQTKNMREFMPNRPRIHIVEVISFTPQKKALEYTETRSAIIRILFVQDNRLGEGLIALTTVPSPEFRGNPGGGLGMGFLLYGLTAPKGELSARLPALLAVGRSFKLSADYGALCQKSRAIDMPVLLSEGQPLKPVLDKLATAWEKRTPTEDMIAEKKADELRGIERLYRPSTGEVYEFSVGFSAAYLSQPQQYSLSDLKPLPDEPTLWLKIPLNGPKLIIKK